MKFPSFGFQRRKRELQEEIDAHLQMAIADRVTRGETVETARQAAARKCDRMLKKSTALHSGNFIENKEDTHYTRICAQNGVDWIDSNGQGSPRRQISLAIKNGLCIK